MLRGNKDYLEGSPRSLVVDEYSALLRFPGRCMSSLTLEDRMFNPEG